MLLSTALDGLGHALQPELCALHVVGANPGVDQSIKADHIGASVAAAEDRLKPKRRSALSQKAS